MARTSATARTLGHYTPSLSGLCCWGGCWRVLVTALCPAGPLAVLLVFGWLHQVFSSPEGAQSYSVRPETPNLTPTVQPLGSSHLNPSSTPASGSFTENLMTDFSHPLHSPLWRSLCEDRQHGLADGSRLSRPWHPSVQGTQG